MPSPHRHRWWPLTYRRSDLPSDLLAGTVVATLLVPQSMAYALLAGLPPQMGLYASVVPTALYGLLGSSRALSVGPSAIIALMVAGALGPLAAAGSPEAAALAGTLALLVAAVYLLLGLVRAGFLANFLSHAVISGFTTSAALVIATGQLLPLTGLSRTPGSGPGGQLVQLVREAGTIHPPTLILGAAALAMLYFFRLGLEPILQRWKLPAPVRGLVTRSGPLAVVILGTVAVAHLQLEEVPVVGEIPAGLPSLGLPLWDTTLASQLALPAVAIALVGFIEGYAVAKALAARERETVDSNTELRALGVANVGAACTGAFPISGGLGRTVVNDAAGARSGLASLVTAALVALTLAFFMPAFRLLPKAVLAAIILVAVLQLVDLKALGRLWRYSRADAFAWAGTFLAVLLAGVEEGILFGAVVALALHLFRTSRPHLAEVGRVGSSEHFRNVLRHSVETWPDLLLVRVDESLYFANTAYLEGRLLEMVANRPQVRHLVLIASAVNFIDGSALESLERLVDELRSAGVTFHLAEVKGPVADRLARTSFLDHLAPGKVFLSTHEAVRELRSSLSSE